MAETPISYFPDFRVGWTPAGGDSYETEIQTARSKREQRREVVQPSIVRRFTAPSDVLSVDMRYQLRAFLRARKGRSQAFYFWSPFRELYEDFAVGSVSAARYLITPLRSTVGSDGQATVTNSTPSVVGSYSDIRLAGVTQTGYTIRYLAPRYTTFASVRMYGGTEKVDCGTSSTLRAVGDVSISAWVWLSSASAANATVITNETLNASGTIVYINSSGNIVFRTSQAGANTAANSNSTVPTDRWTHIAVTRAGLSNPVFYINGAVAGTTGTTSNPVVSTIAFTIGNAASNSFNGMLSEVRFYDAVLSAGAITNIYSGSATASANLRGWWRLSEGTGTTITDYSGYANTGTLSSASLWVGGEDEIDFGSNKTGAVTVWVKLRERITARDDIDNLAYQAFVSGGDLVRYQLAVKEVF